MYEILIAVKTRFFNVQKVFLLRDADKPLRLELVSSMLEAIQSNSEFPSLFYSNIKLEKALSKITRGEHTR